MHKNSLPDHGLFFFRPPYQAYHSVQLGWNCNEPVPGGSAVWFMAAEGDVYAELDWLHARPSWIPLFVVLPEASDDILSLAPVLRNIEQLRPRAVIPTARYGLAPALRILLAAPPPNLAKAVADHLQRIEKVPDIQTRGIIEEIFSVAPHVRSIKDLGVSMCQSRRTLGRFFQARDLPVPSHWLQFARVLHVAIQIQNTNLNINRVAIRFGYTDGFTMSNSMKRLTGYRPSFVRAHLGWEWLIEAWIKREKS